MNVSVKTCLVIPMILSMSCLAGYATADQDWQERQLLAPSASQRGMEQRGRVYIYDGLHEETVDQALDTQFERVENMMFTGVRHVTDGGEEYADDDC